MDETKKNPSDWTPDGNAIPLLAEAQRHLRQALLYAYAAQQDSRLTDKGVREIGIPNLINDWNKDIAVLDDMIKHTPPPFDLN